MTEKKHRPKQPPRRIYTLEEAQEFYEQQTAGNKYTDFGPDLAGVGGFWRDQDRPNIWIAFDFTNGAEVFIEEFDDYNQAVYYAIGKIARLPNGEEI